MDIVSRLTATSLFGSVRSDDRFEEISDVYDTLRLRSVEETKQIFLSLSQIRQAVASGKAFNLVIAGGIGVGKSLRCDAVYNLLSLYGIPVHAQPEYLEHSFEGDAMLKSYIEHNINASEFQMFIQKDWETRETPTKPCIQLFERLPDEAVMIFSYAIRSEDPKSWGLDSEHFLSLKRRVQSINRVKGYPSWCDKDLNLYILDSGEDIFENLKSIIHRIAQDITSDKHTLIIGITVNPAEAIRRVTAVRSREAEKDYDPTYLLTIHGMYEELYSKAPLPEDWENWFG